MKRRLVALALLISLWLLLATGCSSEPPQEQKEPAAHPTEKSLTLIFNGGPRGGTFNFFANKMASIITEDVHWLYINTRQSGGSEDNLEALHQSRADMAIAYAGDAFLARKGTLPDVPERHDTIRALAYLYGAPAQLVVRKDSGINSLLDIKGKTVAIGNPGSGAALSAERFFRHLNLWDSIHRRTVGYTQAAADFAAGRVDGFWVMVGYPNAAVIEAASHADIQILNLHATATASDFYGNYPFYTKAVIPANTYTGQTDPVITFQDSAVWCARADLDDKAVYASLESIFSDQGLADLRRTHKAAKALSLENGIKNLSIPLHPSAARFWAEHQVVIPPILLP